MVHITVGSMFAKDDEPALLRAEKFNRHTFWCGQSGSGKTYALGVVLEQILLQTELPILVLDPNADFTRLNEVAAEAPMEESAGIKAIPIQILHSTNKNGAQVRARFTDLSLASKAAVLQIDPIADAEEFNALLHTEAHPDSFNNSEFISGLRSSGDPIHSKLANRIENLQVLDWDLWARGEESVTDIVDRRPRATVMDLGGFDDPTEPKVAALAVLEHLWATRHSRKPVLIVIDEAHNICSPTPSTAVEQALTRQLIQIAAEGRKFGLWLFLSTQRPTKIHPNVLSQCDNVGLMRINAPRDLTELSAAFGFIPAEQLAQVPEFKQGQGLFAGGFVDSASLVQMRSRITLEGGADVRVPL